MNTSFAVVKIYWKLIAVNAWSTVVIEMVYLFAIINV